MNEDIFKILKEKASHAKLAHFYIITPQEIDYQELSLEWLTMLVQSIAQTKQLESCQDILILKTNKEKEKYNSEHISQIHTFLHYAPNKLKQKILIITQAHKLSELNYNKLLKILEEPPMGLSVFLLNPHKAILLPTIESRAIKVKIKVAPKKFSIFFEKLSPSISFTEFCNVFDEEKITDGAALSELLQLYLKKTSDFKLLEQLKKDLISIEQDILFHNSAQSIRLKIYHSFKKIQSRLTVQ